MTDDQFDAISEQWRRERPDLDSSGLEILWRISFLHKDLRRAAGRRLSDVDLPNWAYDVLASLRRQGHPYELSPSALCEATMLTSGAMTNRLDRLEQSGLVERRPEPGDRRGLIVRLTDKGQELIDRALDIRFQHANAAVGSLNEPERLRLLGLLRKLVVARSHS